MSQLVVTIKPPIDPVYYSSMVEFTSDDHDTVLAAYENLKNLLGPETPLGTEYNSDSWRAIVTYRRMIVLVETPGTLEAMIILAFPDFIREGPLCDYR